MTRQDVDLSYSLLHSQIVNPCLRLSTVRGYHADKEKAQNPRDLTFDYDLEIR